MQAASSPPRQSRLHHRHELRNLSYVTLDEANGGIVRNLNPEGIGVQAVAALHEKQLVRVRFELRYPRLRVDSQGEVAWANSSGQCGIRFVDMPAPAIHSIKEWIFGNLLESIFRDTPHGRPILHTVTRPPREEDGLILSDRPRPVIQLTPAATWQASASVTLDPSAADKMESETDSIYEVADQLDWLSRPLSGRTFAWLIDSLVMIAGFLLFSFVFLSIAHEMPRWPLGLWVAFGAAIFVPGLYCGFTHFSGGATLGVRLAKIAGYCFEEAEDIAEKKEAEVRLR